MPPPAVHRVFFYLPGIGFTPRFRAANPSVQSKLHRPMGRWAPIFPPSFQARFTFRRANEIRCGGSETRAYSGKESGGYAPSTHARCSIRFLGPLPAFNVRRQWFWTAFQACRHAGVLARSFAKERRNSAWLWIVPFAKRSQGRRSARSDDLLAMCSNLRPGNYKPVFQWGVAGSPSIRHHLENHCRTLGPNCELSGSLSARPGVESARGRF